MNDYVSRTANHQAPAAMLAAMAIVLCIRRKAFLCMSDQGRQKLTTS
jgi:hypothetical protein